MKLVVSGSGLRHLVAQSDDAHTLCGRPAYGESGSWEDAQEEVMRDVPRHKHCIRCQDSANHARERFQEETWPDGTPVYPLDFGEGGKITPAELKRLREVSHELERAERERMREVRA
jgi:hypothetical protein